MVATQPGAEGERKAHRRKGTQEKKEWQAGEEDRRKQRGKSTRGKDSEGGGARKAEGNKDDNSIQFNVGKNGK